MFLASLVMAIGFYARIREMEVLFRASVTFAVSWVVVFAAACIIRLIATRELQRAAQEAAAAATTETNESAPEQMGET